MLMQSSWARGSLLGLDFETSGVDVENDRIVSGALIEVAPGVEPVTHTWLIDPGVEISEAATAVHGFSTKHVREHGQSPAGALGEILEKLERLWTSEVPLITFNGSYDLSIMDREGLRHLGEGLPLGQRWMIDGLVIDREVDRYRKGGRKLATVCQHYGVALGADAHHADADTLAAMRLAYKLAARYPGRVGNVALPDLHERQRHWHEQWCTRMARWLEGQAATLGGLWVDGRPAEVAARLAKLEITEEPSDELVGKVCAETRQRAAQFAASASQWPMHPRPAGLSTTLSTGCG
jgi:DNA polymerase-3 subunit epsilon